MVDATKGMVGGGYYDEHSSFQADVAESGAALLKSAVAALSLPAGGQATIADYGCSEGRNSMATVGRANTSAARTPRNSATPACSAGPTAAPTFRRSSC